MIASNRRLRKTNIPFRTVACRKTSYRTKNLLSSLLKRSASSVATTIVGFTVGPVAFDESLADALGLLSALGAGQRFTRGGLRHSTREPNPVPGDPEPNERHTRDNSRGTLREARAPAACALGAQ